MTITIFFKLIDGLGKSLLLLEGEIINQITCTPIYHTHTLQSVLPRCPILLLVLHFTIANKFKNRIGNLDMNNNGSENPNCGLNYILKNSDLILFSISTFIILK